MEKGGKYVSLKMGVPPAKVDKPKARGTGGASTVQDLAGMAAVLNGLG